MKLLRFGLLALACLFMASCGSTDPKALVEKSQKDPSSLTQSDYSEMISYVDQVLSTSDKEREKILNDGDDPLYTFILVCSSASEDFGAYPEMDTKNKEKFEKLQKKLIQVASQYSDMGE